MEPQALINIALGGMAVFGLIRHWRTAHALDDIDGALKPMRRNLDAIVQDWDSEGDGFAALRRMHASLEVFAHRGIERLDADVAALRGEMFGKSEQLMEDIDDLREKRNDLFRRVVEIDSILAEKMVFGVDDRLAALEDGLAAARKDVDGLQDGAESHVLAINGVIDNLREVEGGVSDLEGRMKAMEDDFDGLCADLGWNQDDGRGAGNGGIAGNGLCDPCLRTRT